MIMRQIFVTCKSLILRVENFVEKLSLSATLIAWHTLSPHGAEALREQCGAREALWDH